MCVYIFVFCSRLKKKKIRYQTSDTLRNNENESKDRTEDVYKTIKDAYKNNKDAYSFLEHRNVKDILGVDKKTQKDSSIKKQRDKLNKEKKTLKVKKDYLELR